MVNGALANVNNDEDDQKFTYNLYTTKSVDPTKDFDFAPFSLQDYYGSAIMPSLNWVTKVKTGEVVYDPADEEQNKLLQDYEAFVEANGQIEGLPTPGEIIANEVGPILGQVAEGVGSSLMTGGTFAEGLPFTKSGMDFAEGVTSFSPKALKALDTTTMQNLTEAGMAGGEIATEKAGTVLGGED